MNTSAVLNAPRGKSSDPSNNFTAVADTTLKGLAEVFQMLSDPSRLKILLSLARGGETHVSGLCQLLGQSQPAVSHHLSLLRARKLVSCRRDGKNNFYSVDSASIQSLLEEFFAGAGNGQRQIQLDSMSVAFNNR